MRAMRKETIMCVHEGETEVLQIQNLVLWGTGVGELFRIKLQESWRSFLMWCLLQSMKVGRRKPLGLSCTKVEEKHKK